LCEINASMLHLITSCHFVRFLTRKGDTIAMRCIVRPPSVAPVLLDSNYEAHNAAAYKFNSFTRDVSAISEHLSVFLPKFSPCVQLAFSDTVQCIYTVGQKTGPFLNIKTPV